MSNQRREDKQRRREKRLRKQAARRAGRAAPCPALCGGGPAYTRDECLAAAGADPEGGGVWNNLADPDGVVIDCARVVNRLPRPMEVSVTVAAPGDAGKFDQIETLNWVKIDAQGFIDFGAYGVRPLFVQSPFASEGATLDRLQGDGYCVPEPPSGLGPWHASEIPGVAFTAEYIHNANPNPAKIVAVCRCENEAGNVRCAVFNGVIGGQFLGDVKQMADGAAADLLASKSELASEAAALRASFDADVAAGRLTAAEAADLLSFNDEGERRIVVETVELIAVVPPGRPRRVLRELHDRAAAQEKVG